MQLHWLRDKELNKDFTVFWDMGSNQGADYFTKHHPNIHHRTIRSKYIRDNITSLKMSLIIFFPSAILILTARVC